MMPSVLSTTAKSMRYMVALLGLCVLLTGCDGLGGSWPPKLGEVYPEIEFLDTRGQEVRLSDFQGKVILVEPVGMSCAACNAYSGAQRVGGFQGMRPQAGLESIESYLPRFADGLPISHPDLIVVQILLYNFTMDQPSLEDARIWAEHFGFDRDPNIHVWISKRDLRGRASYKMIPGFYLVDRNLVVRKDSTGHRPRHDLYRELLPSIPQFVNS